MSIPFVATFRVRGRLLAAAAVLVLGAAGAAAAQASSTLQGQVVDSAGKPVASQRLTLHRVNATGGALVDSVTTDAQGRFRFRIPAESDTSAVFFAATRWQGELYIGQPFKPPVPAGQSYTVTVGVNPVQMGPATGGGAGPMGSATGAPAVASPQDDSRTGRWFLIVILALIAIGSVAYALLRAPGAAVAAGERPAQRRRELLARIAELDERAAAGGSADELSALRRERAELLARLAGD